MTRAEQGEALALCFFVEFPGMSTFVFRELFAVGSENCLVVQGQVNATGKASYVRMPGELAWSNLVLRNGIDTDMSLWNWRNSVITAGVDGQEILAVG